MTNENINRPSYFSILTADVRYDKDLSASEKIFYSEITCLCQVDGFCYFTFNYYKYFSFTSNFIVFNFYIFFFS